MSSKGKYRQKSPSWSLPGTKMLCHMTVTIKGSNFKLEGLTSCHLYNKPATKARAFGSGNQLHASNKQPISLSGICILLLPKDGYWHSLSTLLVNSGEKLNMQSTVFSAPFLIRLSKHLLSKRDSEAWMWKQLLQMTTTQCCLLQLG